MTHTEDFSAVDRTMEFIFILFFLSFLNFFYIFFFLRVFIHVYRGTHLGRRITVSKMADLDRVREGKIEVSDICLFKEKEKKGGLGVGGVGGVTLKNE